MYMWFFFICNYYWGFVIVVIIEVLFSIIGMLRELCLNFFYYYYWLNNFVYDLNWNKECEIYLML